MMKTRQIIFPAKGQVTLAEQQLADPRPDQVLVENLFSAISPGTELAVLHQLPNATWPFPIQAGYSACGRVQAVGSLVTHIKSGDLVATNGLHAAHTLVDASSCWLLPDGLDPKAASLFRLLSIALQGVRKANLQLGESVAVVGLGIIGNLAGQLAMASGATFVAGIDLVDWRRELALSLGFDMTCATADQALEQSITPLLANTGQIHAGEKASAAQGFDVVIEATGAAEPINQALTLPCRMGRMVLLGSTRGLTEKVDFYKYVHCKGLTLIGAHESIRATSQDTGSLFTPRHDGQTSLNLLALGRVRVEPLISSVVQPEDAPAAYASLAQKDHRMLTTLIDWRH